MRQAVWLHEWMCIWTLRCQVVAAVDASVDDVEAGHWQQHLRVPCQVAQVLVQGNLLCCGSSLHAERQSAIHPVLSSKICPANAV